jgi:hypothetical protein
VAINVFYVFDLLFMRAPVAAAASDVDGAMPVFLAEFPMAEGMYSYT